MSHRLYILYNVTLYSLDIVDSSLFIRGRLPAKGQSPAPAAVPGGVRGQPARAAGHVTEIKAVSFREYQVRPSLG